MLAGTAVMCHPGMCKNECRYVLTTLRCPRLNQGSVCNLLTDKLYKELYSCDLCTATDAQRCCCTCPTCAVAICTSAGQFAGLVTQPSNKSAACAQSMPTVTIADAQHLLHQQLPEHSTHDWTDTSYNCMACTCHLQPSACFGATSSYATCCTMGGQCM